MLGFKCDFMHHDSVLNFGSSGRSWNGGGGIEITIMLNK